MNERIRVLAINPGSTSTKIALFDNYEELFRATLEHSPGELRPFKEIQDQLGFRGDVIERAMAEKGYEMEDVDIFAGRGGGLLSMESGVYEVTGLLISHAAVGMAGKHPAQLASQICARFAGEYGKRAYVVNPPDVDEFCDEARVSGLKGIYRESHTHALNQKEIALRFCAARGLKYEEVSLVICHLGGGSSITAHEKGRMIDSNDIIRGSGPMTPTRAGDMPYMEIIELAYSGEYTKKELTDRLNKNGGLTDHFGTADVREVIRMAENGDRRAEAVLNGMIYQSAKYVGAMAAALRGKIDAVILTGGMANGKYLTGRIKEYIGWIAEVVIMPGEFELEALAAGALRVGMGQERAKSYSGVPIWNGF